MRLVTIDNGNTNPSVAYFNDGILIDVHSLKDYVWAHDDFVLISSVGKPLEIKPSFDLKTKRSKTHFFDMKVHYSETLGDDRLIAAYGVFKKLKQNQKVLLIDAGTFITCDLVSADGFEGGFIFPGLSRFLNSYKESAQLPQLSTDQLFSSKGHELPHDTNAAILGGTELYAKSIIEGVIKKTSPDKIIFTGGSAGVLKNNVNSTIPFELDPHLLHLALSMIYQTHLAQE